MQTHVTEQHKIKGQVLDADGKFIGFECGVCGATIDHATTEACIKREEITSYTGYKGDTE